MKIIGRLGSSNLGFCACRSSPLWVPWDQRNGIFESSPWKKQVHQAILNILKHWNFTIPQKHQSNLGKFNIKKHTKIQWMNWLVFPSPTALKVAINGDNSPYAAPPKMLPTMPAIGHKTNRKKMKIHSRIFRNGPSILALPSKKFTITSKIPLENESS